MVAPFSDRASRFLTSPDGTSIAVFRAGSGPPLVLVHGITGDHRTWRVVGPELAHRYALHAIDRRGRGDSGDAPAYAIERELEDVATVAEAAAAEAGSLVDVLGHSLGGRIALGASLLTPAIGRVVAYESVPAAAAPAAAAPAAPTPAAAPDGEPAGGASRDRLLERLRADLAAGDLEGLLARFMAEAAGMTPEELARFRADPVWPLRVAAAPTIIRELAAADEARAISMDQLAQVRIPVLQLVGSESPPTFREDAASLGRRLADGRLVVIEGARHAAHHSHPEAFLAAVEAFLAG